MDQTAANFITSHSRLRHRTNTRRLVDEHDLQKGMVYHRRVGSEIQMAAEITKIPRLRKAVLFTDSKVEVYQPRDYDQITRYCLLVRTAATVEFPSAGFRQAAEETCKQVVSM